MLWAEVQLGEHPGLGEQSVEELGGEDMGGSWSHVERGG